MKRLILPFLAIFLTITSCSKDEIDLTGDLKMTFKLTDKDYSNVQIDIYLFDNLNYSICSGSPDNNGVFSKELLYGNYAARIYYKYERAAPRFQIINGKTASFDFNY